MFDDYTIVIAGIVYNAIFGLVTMSSRSGCSRWTSC